MHSHNHDHDHHHHHHVAPADMGRIFLIGLVLNLLFVVVEFTVGMWTKSLSLRGDAAHNLSDAIGLFLAWLGFFLSKKQANHRYTFGYKKATILVSLINSGTLIAVLISLTIQAVQHILHPHEISGEAMSWTAFAGLILYGTSALLFFKSKDHDLNAKSAYLHLITDIVSAIGVMIAGLLIKYTGWYVWDSIMTLIIVAMLFFSFIRLFKQSFVLAMNGVPDQLDLLKLKALIGNYPGIKEVHDIRVWAISTQENALTAHIVVDPQMDFSTWQKTSHAIEHQLLHENIHFVTLQPEGRHIHTHHAE